MMWTTSFTGPVGDSPIPLKSQKHYHSLKKIDHCNLKQKWICLQMQTIPTRFCFVLIVKDKNTTLDLLFLIQIILIGRYL